MIRCFAIRDVKAEGFSTPFFQPTFGLAERAFKELAADEKSTVFKNKEDFSLYHVGDFNPDNGEFLPEKQPKYICNAM